MLCVWNGTGMYEHEAGLFAVVGNRLSLDILEIFKQVLNG